MTKDKLKLLLGYRFDAAAEDEGCEGERRVRGKGKGKRGTEGRNCGVKNREERTEKRRGERKSM